VCGTSLRDRNLQRLPKPNRTLYGLAQAASGCWCLAKASRRFLGNRRFRGSFLSVAMVLLTTARAFVCAVPVLAALIIPFLPLMPGSFSNA
jgi:hypothetical protein